MKKYVGMVLLSVFITVFGFSSYASATDTFSTKTATDTTAPSKTSSLSESARSQVPTVTIEQAEKWAEKKGFEVVHLLQKVVQPFAIIMFILSAFMALAGAFGNSQLVGRGIWGMFIAVIMYAVVLYAPEIMDSVLNWLTDF